MVLRICLNGTTLRRVKTLSVKLPEALAEALRREARRAQVSQSELVRNVLDQHFGKAPASTLDRIGDLAGCVDSGLGDLSSNREYLAGFGR